MRSRFFQTKPLAVLLTEAGAADAHSLRRVLGPVNLISLGIGAIIGAGIFVITGSASAQHAGPAIVVSFLLAGAGCAFAGLCYAEFASLIPIAGSAYTYGYATLGEFFAWLIGWDLIIEYAFGAATVASGWSGNLVSMLQDFGLALPPQFIATPGTRLVLFNGRWEQLAVVEPALRAAGIDSASLPHATGVFDIFAFLVVAAVTAILVIGIRESAAFNTAMVIVKVGTILVFLAVVGAYLFKNPSVAMTHWSPFLPANSGEFGSFGWSGIARGAAVVFFAYIGFDAVSTAAQEARNPQRDMPIGILASLGICTVLYILMGATLTGIVHYSQLNVAAPVAVAIDAADVRWGSVLVKAGTFAGLGTTMLVMLLGQSRIFFSMSRDGLLPPWAGRIHPRFRTPWLSSILTGLFVGGFAALVPIGILGQLTSIGTLFAFVIVCAGVWMLRRRQPDLHRPFRAPAVPLVPILGIAISLFLMLSLPWDTWLRLLVWLLLGLAVYFGYGSKHSRVQTLLAQNPSRSAANAPPDLAD
jgi:APA family basic amino acid/polyamine antiporter